MQSSKALFVSLVLPRTARSVAVLGLLALGACGGGGGGGGNGGVGGTPNPPPAGTTVAISGKITFDRVPFKTSGAGLNLNAPVEAPARGVVVEALSTTGTITSTTTDASGNYSLTVPTSTSVKIRAKAQMVKTGTAPTFNFSVLNNTNGDALYAIDGAFADSGTAASTRNLRATSGWNGTAYVAAQRTAAPFAILDTVYRAETLLLSASATIVFPVLNLYWSPDNKPSDSFCPDTGNIVSSVYFAFDQGEKDECTTPTTGLDGIYILGNFVSNASDTDEFDQHVIAHEFGHYLEDKFSRSDSIGGEHSLDDRLDPRVAFGEGFGDAFSGMALNDPVYRDSRGTDAESGFDMEAGVAGASVGWFSESSIFEILWDVFDSGTESGDTVFLGFAPIYNAFIGPEKNTEALTSIYSFSAALIAANSGSATGIRSLLTREQITGDGEFGTNETNFAGKAILNPVYTPIGLNVAAQVCGTRDFGIENKLGHSRFLQLTLTSPRALQITVQGLAGGAPTPTPDPLVAIWRRGFLQVADDSSNATEIMNTATLQAGTYIIEVAEYTHFSSDPQITVRRGDTCMTVTVQ